MTVTWTEAFSSFTPVGTGWQNYDIFTNKSVPKGAIAYIICASVNDAAARTIGVRTDGSAINRYTKLHEGEAGGAVCTEMYVKVDASTGLIETYCDSTTGITFYLLGYWTGVDFTEMYTDLTSGSASTWTDSDIYTNQSVPKGRVVQIQCDNFNDGAAATVGVRTNGSGLARYRNLHEAESSTTEYTDCNAYSICVLSNATDGIIELWRSDATYGKHFLMGYFGPELSYVESAPTAGSIGSASTWTDWDLTAYLDRDGRVVEIICGHSATGAEYQCGARINGSGLARYILEHEAESNGENGSTYPVQTDATGIVEIWCSTSSSEQFDYMGYFRGETFTVDKTALSDARFIKTQEVTKASDTNFKAVHDITKYSDSLFFQVATQSIQKTSDSVFKGTEILTKNADTRFLKTQTIGGAAGEEYDIFHDVCTTDTLNSVIGTRKNRSFMANGRFWVTYVNNSYFCIRSSTDGTTWSSETQIRAAGTTSDTFAIWVDGTTFYYVYTDGVRYFYFRKGVAESDGSITWAAAEQTVDTDPSVWGVNPSRPSICADSNGIVYVAFNMTSPGSGIRLIRNDNTDGTWSTTSGWGDQGKEIVSSSNSARNVKILPVTNGDIVCIWFDNSYSNPQAKEWDISAGAFTAQCDAGDKLQCYQYMDYAWDACVDGEDVHLVYNTDYQDGSQQIRYRKRTSQNTWGSGAYICSGLDTTATFPCVSVNLTSHYVYVMYSKVADESITYYKVYTDSWSGEQTLCDDTNNHNPYTSLSCGRILYSGTLVVVYSTGTGSPYTIRMYAYTFEPEAGEGILSDAKFKKVVDITKLSDAIFKTTQNVSKLSDAVITAPITTYEFTKYSDTRIIKTQEATKLSDSRYKKLAQELTKLTDSRFRKTIDISKLSDTKVWVGTQTLTKYSDTRLNKTQEVSKTNDTRFKKLAQEISKLTDSRFRKTQEIIKLSDTRLKKTQLITKLSDTKIWVGTATLNKFSDTRLKKAQEISKLSDSRFRKTVDINKLSDNRFIKIQTLTKLSDTKFWIGIITLNKFSDVRFDKTQELIKLADSRFKKTSDITKLSDTRLKKTQNITKLSDTKIWVGTTSIQKTSDTRFKTTQTTAKTSDTMFGGGGIIFKNSDSRFRKTQSLTNISDARFLLIETKTIVIYSNARFKTAQTSIKPSDSRFRITPTLTNISDSRFKKIVTITNVSDTEFKTTQFISLNSTARFITIETFNKISDTRFRIIQALTKNSISRFMLTGIKTILSDTRFRSGFPGIEEIPINLLGDRIGYLNLSGEDIVSIYLHAMFTKTEYFEGEL